jgi:cytochrome c oxidase subunit III
MAVQTETNATLPAHPEKATFEGKNKVLGFWFFLGGETVLFATLFGTYLGLRGNTNGGPGPQDLFHLDLVFYMTVFLLLSSLTSVLAIWAMQRQDYIRMQVWFGVTVLLGLAFLGFEIYEFYEYVHQGLGYGTSAFASSFYTLVGFHGAHVLFGLCWIVTLQIRATKQGINLTNAPKFYVASLYWHFIDVVWVFIFTAVYLLGKVG